MKSKKEAPDDAISATKAAVAEGIVPGGDLHYSDAQKPWLLRRPNVPAMSGRDCKYSGAR